jgi:cytohesin
VNSEKLTPLHAASAEGHAEVVAALLAAGAEVNAKEAMGSTPLHAAAFEGQLEAVKLLVEGGADLRAINNNKTQPLAAAQYVFHNEVAQYLRNAMDREMENPAKAEL